MTAQPKDDQRIRALAEIERDYPGWRAWAGVLAGVVYARRPHSSPPLVVRAITRPTYVMSSKPPRQNEG